MPTWIAPRPAPPERTNATFDLLELRAINWLASRQASPLPGGTGEAASACRLTERWFRTPMETGGNGGDPGPMNGKNAGLSGANRHVNPDQTTRPRLQALRDAG